MTPTSERTQEDIVKIVTHTSYVFNLADRDLRESLRHNLRGYEDLEVARRERGHLTAIYEKCSTPDRFLPIRIVRVATEAEIVEEDEP